VLMLSHPAIFYFMDSGPGETVDGVEWKESTLAQKPPGTLMVWDPIYGVFNSDVARSITLGEIEEAGWVRESLPEDIGGDWHIFVTPEPTSRPAR